MNGSTEQYLVSFHMSSLLIVLPVKEFCNFRSKPKQRIMNEEFLQYAWKFQLFQHNHLHTVQGEPIQVLHPGTWNTDSGPDFFNAHIKIGDTLWAGNVEVHIKASDWIKHQHQNDEMYNNVILHVVSENDVELTLPNGQYLPVLVMLVCSDAKTNYQRLIAEDEQPACSEQLYKVDTIYISSMLDAMLTERMENKTKRIETSLNNNRNDWNETFYQQLSINLGFQTNAQPFEMLARHLPLNVLARHHKNLLQLEALLFGQSGMLNEELLGDDYFLQLRSEYSYLAGKYNLKGMEGHLWKFMRMRPANFPSIRLAQLAALLHQSEALFSKIINTENPENIRNFFRVEASEYWDTHYRFNVPSIKGKKVLGANTVDNILINTVAPFLYLYGFRNSKPELMDRAFALLELLPAESNKIINRWKDLQVKIANAYDSQALIQLRNAYCNQKKCLRCQIGNKIINQP
jgi:hypothetical protein